MQQHVSSADHLQIIRHGKNCEDIYKGEVTCGGINNDDCTLIEMYASIFYQWKCMH